MSLCKDLFYLILQFFDEEGLRKSAHMLERETGLFFDMKYFEELVLGGDWDETERYLSGFTKLEDDKYSTKIYFEIRKQKFLEAMEENDRARALDILMKDLKVFASSNEELYKEMTQLLTLDDFRKHCSLSSYGDKLSARKNLMDELTNIFEANPLFNGKLKFPQINKSRLRRLVNQSLNWQHIHCTHPHTSPEINTLFVDHQCPPTPLPDHPYDQSVENSTQQSIAMSVPAMPISGTNSSTFSTVSATEGAVDFCSLTNLDVTTASVEESDNISKRNSAGTEVLSSDQSHTSMSDISADLPKTLGRTLSEESSPTSMDFHPLGQTLLLVGTNVGHIGLWEITSGEKLFSKKFSVWKIKAISMAFLVTLLKDPHVSVNRILWSPDGLLFGVAYSKHIIQLYSYHGGSNIQKHLEVDAHVGGVNDIAFSKQRKELFVISCGDDKLIQVWNASTGAKQYRFEGHSASVYSVCAHFKEMIHFLFTTSTNGELKAWLFDNLGPRVAYDTPGLCCTKMAYSTDGKRLFSCGTTKDGETHIVEWNESEGCVMRAYQGLRNCSLDVVQFDTSNNRYLAAGEDHLVKIWDMDHVELLTTIDADGGLPASPCVRFNKKGNFLAVFANHNRIKILANDDGLQLLQTSENISLCASRALSQNIWESAVNQISNAVGAEERNGSVSMNGDTGNMENIEARSPIEPDVALEEVGNFFEINEPSQAEPDVTLEVGIFSEISEPSQVQSSLLTGVKAEKISRLTYTTSGNAILALATNGIHSVWKWWQNEANLNGQVSLKVSPKLWEPRRGLAMSNDISGINLKEVSCCFALSKNNSYLVSASGGRISLFNMVTFKTITTFMPPPPAATYIAFYPQDNNIIAIGMDDSTILIYNIRADKIITKLEGHAKRVTGLSFSTVLNLLVSSTMDSQIVSWNSNNWEKKKSTLLQIPSGRSPSAPSDVFVQFHQDQIRFLAVHETHLAIYEATELECLNQWITGNSYSRISHATFSCDGLLIFAGFLDGSVSIFGASDLCVRCEINPSAYLPVAKSFTVYPVVIAAHPQKANQFAMGLSDGKVVIMEPLECEGRWGLLPSDDDSVSSITLQIPQGIVDEFA